MPGRTVILCYHRVNESPDDPFDLCVRPDRFAEQLEALARRARLVPLDEVGQPARGARAVVTFDDGYADNLVRALPVAEELGVPFTVYVTTGAIGSPTGFWWDRLGRLVRHGAPGPVTVPLKIGTEVLEVRIGDRRRAAATIAEVRQRLLPLPVEEIDRVLQTLGNELGTHTSAPVDARPLDHAELARLARHPLVTIGAHTTDHRRLRGLPFEEQVDTISASRQRLEEELGTEVRHFAYPFGGPDSFDEASVSAVGQCGFQTAVTTRPGSLGRHPAPLTLRRRLVMDWSGPRFSAQMLRWGLV